MSVPRIELSAEEKEIVVKVFNSLIVNFEQYKILNAPIFWPINSTSRYLPYRHSWIVHKEIYAKMFGIALLH